MANIDLDTAEFDFVEACLHRSHMRNVAFAAKLLRKLSVAELRALYKHYFKITLAPGEIPKSDLIAELADRYAEEEFDA